MRHDIRSFLTVCYLVFGFWFSVCLYAASLGTPDPDDIEYPYDDVPSSGEVELGKMLFFDPRLSANKRQSCATCHNPDLGFSDGLSKGFGSEGRQLVRHTPHLYNLAWSAVFLWDGRARSLEEQALIPIESVDEMNLPLDQLIFRLKAVGEYRQRFKAVYGEQGITRETIGRALASFQRTLISRNSPFDRYITGDLNAMSPSAIRGLALFQGKARCNQCHDGSNFTDDSFHNLGVVDSDPGRFGVDAESKLIGAFKTPGLRNVGLTAPYMHDGSIPTLASVVKFYNRGGGNSRYKDKLIVPLNLIDQEMNDLVAFMRALTAPVIISRPALPPDGTTEISHRE